MARLARAVEDVHDVAVRAADHAAVAEVGGGDDEAGPVAGFAAREHAQGEVEVVLEAPDAVVGGDPVAALVGAGVDGDVGGLGLEEVEVGEGRFHVVPALGLDEVIGELAEAPHRRLGPRRSSVVAGWWREVAGETLVVDGCDVGEELVAGDVVELAVEERDERGPVGFASGEVAPQVVREARPQHDRELGAVGLGEDRFEELAELGGGRRRCGCGRAIAVGSSSVPRWARACAVGGRAGCAGRR